MSDPRQRVPGTDRVLTHPEVAAAADRLGHRLVKHAVHTAQQRARDGEITVSAVIAETLAALPDSAASSRPVLNATGVLLHTNLGRAPLSQAAVDALRRAAGTTDVELDLSTGRRGPRGAAALAALLAAVPRAEAAHVVNNGAAALSLAATALAQGREIVLARGEMVEIGDGFRLPELLTATGARLREIGTTNRVRLDDYRAAVGPDTGFVLKVHPSNFVITGFTSAVPVAALRGIGAPVVVDIGSGLLHPHPVLPAEPDATSVLADGADLVLASGDKLLGGPQAGLLLGRAEIVQQLRHHPLARAMRVDKLTLAALEATLRGPSTPIEQALRRDQQSLLRRAERLAEALSAAGVPASAQPSEATVGGGGAPGVALPSAAVVLPARFAELLRSADPAVLACLAHDRCLLDLAALPPEDDDGLRRAVLGAA
ncbi:L-seryl-tRNA(Ser) seleniumtransferase [Saccharopolyspora antimicrobica]|uniref:L-seryl-tRNA(Sec) selenium transferase n=1 Tax=Saccharopolyspora antimicrobica TaxID=455193 RepID=A0A1I4R424_9PSEU|nr:L-seryl-tRNA(Sec) selenium transferase [Saccharopolyspora antimicrobica]RKT88177.1 L-seryl-tRNA(Sec) selenium transferase [Saccharopolyspora antimicrobica]SFM47007.1 L-seryl-tRNA(Ser) seleniumtransferase [Saccharopolyspora antimicrobica]